ncbi:hypothetical protein ACLMJK_005545 [Lecanora helva]
MFTKGKLRRSLCLLFVPFLIASSIFLVQRITTGKVSIPKLEDLDPRPPASTGPPKVLHKPPLAQPPPITDNFPLAAKATSPTDLPPIPEWNRPPSPHVNESTPLFIGFTRNWSLLQQVVVSYIVAGWPPEDIYVIENTGVMNSNRDGKLTLQNPFYLDHHRLTEILGVNVIHTPTLFTFAQMQNFFIYTALEHGWSHYFWAHMDTVVVSDEEWDGDPWKPLYARAVDALRETLDPAWGPLATRWFAYDHLALVRTEAFVDVGGWDTMIPFYLTDCDMHERLWMRGFRIENAQAGKVWDVASAIDDMALLYQRGGDSVQKVAKKREAAEEANATTSSIDTASKLSTTTSTPPQKSSAAALPTPSATITRSSVLYHEILRALDTKQHEKNAHGGGGRNTWQSRQMGGQGEPFYRDPEGFEESILSMMEWGKSVFAAKWGRDRCDLRDSGLGEGDAWRVVRGWEDEGVQREFWRERRKEEKEKVAKEKVAKEVGGGEKGKEGG